MADFHQTDSLEDQLRQQHRLARTLRRRRRMRWLIPLLIVLLLIAAAVIYISLKTGREAPEEETQPVSDSTVTLAAVGDISMTRSMLQQFRKGDDYDFSSCFQWVTPQISAADIAVANLEGNITDLSGADDYNYPPALLTALADCGFDVLQTANSYSIQNGITGLQRTKQAVLDAGLTPLGTYLSKADREQSGGVYIKDVNGIRFAFIGLTKGMNNMRLPEGEDYSIDLLYSDYDTNYSQIAQSAILTLVENALAQNPDVVVAMVHWGSEYISDVNSSQERIAKLLFENGVDVIIGSHSHLVGKMERKRVSTIFGTREQGFIAYSLGDFVSASEEAQARSGCILNLQFSKHNGETTLTGISYSPTYTAIPSADLENRVCAVYDTLNAVTLYESGYYDRVSTPLYERMLEELEDMPEQTESDYQRKR